MKDYTTPSFWAVMIWLVFLSVFDIYVKHQTVQYLEKTPVESTGKDVLAYNYLKDTTKTDEDLAYYRVASENWKALYMTCQAAREAGR